MAMTYSEVVGQEASPCMKCMLHPSECSRCNVHAIWLEKRKQEVKETLEQTSRMIKRLMKKYGN